MLAVSADLVADAANRSNQGAVVSGIHFAAQIVDIPIHDVGHGVKIEFPDLLDDGSALNLGPVPDRDETVVLRLHMLN